MHLARVARRRRAHARRRPAQQRARISALAVRRVLDMEARDVALLGLSFKPQTDDLRESPFVELAETLVGKGFGYGSTTRW